MSERWPRYVFLFLFIMLLQIILGPVADRTPASVEFAFMATLSLVALGAFIWLMRDLNVSPDSRAQALAGGVIAGVLTANTIVMLARFVEELRA